MKSTIKKIYEKELGYHEMKPNDKEYLETEKEFNKAYDALKETLNEEQEKLLNEFYVQMGDVEWVLQYLSFKDGFRAGVRLGMEVGEEE